MGFNCTYFTITNQPLDRKLNASHALIQLELQSNHCVLAIVKAELSVVGNLLS